MAWNGFTRQRGVATSQALNRLVRRVVDADVLCQPGEPEDFLRFYCQLMGLLRKTILGVMCAIRTYASGMQRVADDLELAYTLLVAAGEFMAQDFDGYEATWDSVSEQERFTIDAALAGAAAQVVKAVRAAVLSTEHTSLARHFSLRSGKRGAWPLSNRVRPDVCPLGRIDLPEALASAYRARSLYVHQLRALPDMVTVGHGYFESVLDDRRRDR